MWHLLSMGVTATRECDVVSQRARKVSGKRSGCQDGNTDLEMLKPVEMKEGIKAFQKMSVEGEVEQDGMVWWGTL